MLAQLEEWGVRTSALFGRLDELRADKKFLRVFAEVMHCELHVEGPHHDIEGLDPSFVPIAACGNGDFYGLYAYPPARRGADWEDPVVQFFHDVPSVEFEASTLEAWLRRGIARSRKTGAASTLERKLGLRPIEKRERARNAANERLRKILPVEKKTRRLRPAGLARFLVGRCPPRKADLQAWEREWVAWWMRQEVADALEEAALVDYGLEAYRKLGWQFQALTLMHASRFIAGGDAVDREARSLELWSRVHAPSTIDLAEIVRVFAHGDERSASILKHWAETYSWREVNMRPERRRERRALGRALSAAIVSATRKAARVRLGEALVLFELEEVLETLVQQAGLEDIRGALVRLRAQHERQRASIVEANDWSDVVVE